MSKYCITLTWDDAPHLDNAVKTELLASIPPYQRDARSKGIPSLGSGAVYPIPQSEIIIPGFPIPEHWPRCFAMDVGWKKTAVIWGARDPDTGTVYLYEEYYRGQAEPPVHAAAVIARGDWIPGVIDPAARGRSQIDGRNLITLYTEQGLNLEYADNSVDAGIYATWLMFSKGQLKVFESLTNWANELRTYCRDEHGRVVKEYDHLMDCMRYLVLSGQDIMRVNPNIKSSKHANESHGALTWLSR